MREIPELLTLFQIFASTQPLDIGRAVPRRGTKYNLATGPVLGYKPALFGFA
jgi:hypothetical protein